MSTCSTWQPRSSPGGPVGGPTGGTAPRLTAAPPLSVAGLRAAGQGAGRAGAAGWRRRGTAVVRTGRARATAALPRRPARCRATALGTRSATTRTPCTCSTTSPAPATSACSCVAVEAAADAVGGAPAAGRVGEGARRLVRVAGERARQHGRGAVGDEQAEPAARAAARRRRRRAPAAGSSTTSSTLWHSSRSTLPAATSCGQVVEVALHAGDPAVEAALGGAALQRGERVGAGVDDGDAVPGAASGTAKPPVPPPASTTSRPCAGGVGLGEDGGQHLPHDRGAGGRRRTGCGRRRGQGGGRRSRAGGRRGLDGRHGAAPPGTAGRGGLAGRA